MITGKVDTRSLVPTGGEMAEREWRRMKGRRIPFECRNCHQLEYMDFSCRASGRPDALHQPTGKQGPTPASTATRGIATNCLT